MTHSLLPTRASRTASLLASLAALSLAGCPSPGVVGEADGGAPGPDASMSPDGGGPGIPGLTQLRIDPGSAEVIDDGAAPGESATFTAVGVFEDGSERDVTAEVQWTIDDVRLGAINGGVFTSAQIGGTTTIRARASGQVASAELRVVLELMIAGPEVPVDGPAMFPADPSGDLTGDPGAITIVYPSDGTLLPRNLQRISHQWETSEALDLFEVRFDSDVARLRLYAAGDELLITPETWAFVAETHAGGSVAVTVRGLSTDSPEVVHRSQTITELYSQSEVLGALYYWSTGTQGVMRAHISAPTADLFYDDPESENRECVSCHTVSRDGRRMAVAYGGERLRNVSVPDREVLIPDDPAQDGPDYGWGTFNPGATRLLYANDGALTLLDGETGAVLRQLTLPDGMFATHPDWSPDGSYVAIAVSSGRRPGNKEVEASSLARIPVLADDTFGEPEVLLASDSGADTMFFPSYSPDSRWIAFVRATGKSKDNETSRLLLLAADGGGAPIELAVLNERVRERDDVTSVGNSMPTWAPSTTPEVFWLAFSSIRDYGHRLRGTERDQLWAAAIDPARAAAAEDPSYAAFWMPFQSLEEGNHRAFWALAAEDTCPSTSEICDGLDNDCDGIVDNQCCTPIEEICGNGLDEDCDGVPDDGCGCQPVEQCNNGLDDDCDMLIDAADEDCAPE